MNGLLVCAGDSKMKNIGDYVQTLAQEQYWNKIDCYVERENLSEYHSNESTNLIMNAWYMWHPEKFPPSESINPLFVSIHIAPSKASAMLSQKAIEYLKRHEPIGARDLGTKEILEQNGIQSYFSACLTLTLGLKYKQEGHLGGPIFVDPFVEIGGRNDIPKAFRALRASYLFLKHFSKVKKLYSRFSAHINTRIGMISKKLEKLLMCASFYDVYSRLFTDDVLLNAEYITHELPQKLFKDDNDKLEYARNLVKKYADAKFVVTSRIHCALPCLGVETPVLFITSSNLESGNTRSGGRFGGLDVLLHVIRYDEKSNLNIESVDIAKELDKLGTDIIGQDFSFCNKEEYKKYAEKLEDVVSSFVREYGN